MMGTAPVKYYIENKRVKWFGHLLRMNPEIPAAGACTSKTPGHRELGPQRKMWIDGVKDTETYPGLSPCSGCPKLSETVMV